MRILLIMDPGIPVPPRFYGGHERLVYLFAEEYQRCGHEVTLLAGPDSYCSGDTVTFGENNLLRSKKSRRAEVFFTWKYLWRNRNKFDLIHNFGRLIYLLPVLNADVRKIMTYGRPVARRGIKIMNNLPNRNIVFTACSNYCVSTGDIEGRWQTVYNTIDFSAHQLNEHVEDDAPLIFLGRLDRIKGAHTAIAVAKQTSGKLWIAGNIPETAGGRAYYQQEVEPLIDNQQIIYLGALNDSEKNKYLGKAKALLFPIEWDEPFGMVMVEAMACGTPVIAYNRGAVPEIVTEGVNGFIVNNEREMADAILLIKSINRITCRADAEARFNTPAVAQTYLNLFEQ